MTLQPLHCHFPPLMPYANSSHNGLVVGMTTGYPHGIIFRVPKSGTLDLFEFRLATVTTAEDLDLEFRSVSETTGIPVAPDQARTIASADLAAGWTTPGLMTSDGTDSGAKRTVTQGELLCCSWRWPGTAGNIGVNTHFYYAGAGTFSNNLPFPCFQRSLSADGTMTDKTVGTRIPFIALKYDDGTYGNIPFLSPRDASGSTAVNFTSAASPDEVGFRFILPVTVQATGIWCYFGNVATRPFTLRVMDDAGAVLTTALAWPGNLTAAGGIRNWNMHFSGAVTLQANTAYRVSVEATAGGSNMTAYTTLLASADHRAAWGRDTWSYIHRTNGGAWTDDDTRIFHAGLLLSAIDDGD